MLGTGKLSVPLGWFGHGSRRSPTNEETIDDLGTPLIHGQWWSMLEDALCRRAVVTAERLEDGQITTGRAHFSRWTRGRKTSEWNNSRLGEHSGEVGPDEHRDFHRGFWAEGSSRPKSRFYRMGSVVGSLEGAPV